jgi:hypothetical protein
LAVFQTIHPLGQKLQHELSAVNHAGVLLVMDSVARKSIRRAILGMLYLEFGGNPRMTYLEVAYQYGATPGEREMRAIDGVREVYGIRKIDFYEKEKTVRVEFDASRLNEDAVAKLLRQAGIDVRDRLALA